MWDTSEGSRKKAIAVAREGYIRGLSVNPSKDRLAVGYKKVVNIVDLSTEQILFKIPNVDGKKMLFLGDRVITYDEYNVVVVRDDEGQVVNKLHGIEGRIVSIFCVPDTTSKLVVVGREGSWLLNIPTTPDEVNDADSEDKIETDNGCIDGGVKCCGVFSGGVEYFTLTDNTLQIWNATTHQPIRGTINTSGEYLCADTHPTKQIIIAGIKDQGFSVVYGYHQYFLCLMDTTDLTTISKIHIDGGIGDVKVSPKGNKCVILYSSLYKPQVINIIPNETINSCGIALSDAKYEMKGEVYCVDIDQDGVRVVTGGERSGIDIWNINTGKKITTLVENGTVSNV